MDVNYVKPSFEVLEIPDPNDGADILRFLERVARVCYKSEDKICDGSAERLMRVIMEKGHHSVIEHYTFTFAVSPKVYKSVCMNPISADGNEDYINALRYIHYTNYKSKDEDVPRYIISGNIRAFSNLYRNRPEMRRDCYGIERIMSLIKQRVPDLVDLPDFIEPLDESVEVHMMTRDDVFRLPESIRKYHNWFSVRFIMDRSISHQLVRHRDSAFAMESTRYINYAKKGYTIILPHWMPDGIKEALMEHDDDPQVWQQFPADMVVSTKAWCMGVEKLLETYNYMMNMRDHHFIPDDLKGAIPESIKTEIIMTTTESEWEWVLKQRTDGAAHPQIEALMLGLRDYFKNEVAPQYKYKQISPEERKKKIEEIISLIEEAQEDMIDEAGSAAVRILDAKPARDRHLPTR